MPRAQQPRGVTYLFFIRFGRDSQRFVHIIAVRFVVIDAFQIKLSNQVRSHSAAQQETKKKGDNTHVYKQRLVLLLAQPARLAPHQFFIYLGLALQRRASGLDRHPAHRFELDVMRCAAIHALVRSRPYSRFLSTSYKTSSIRYVLSST